MVVAAAVGASLVVSGAVVVPGAVVVAGEAAVAGNDNDIFCGKSLVHFLWTRNKSSESVLLLLLALSAELL